MSIRLIVFAVAFCAASFASSSRAVADDAIVGRIRHAGNGTFAACFDRTTPVAIGTRLTIVRHAIVAPDAKATAGIRTSDIGTGEIIAVDSDGRCATVRLTDGNAAALDWLSLAR